MVRKVQLGLLAFLLAFCVTPVRAQITADGSIYSRFGIGELRPLGSSQLQGMGGGGTASSNLTYVNPANPASMADQILTRFAMGLNFQVTDARDQTGTHSRLSHGSLGSLALSFPILDRKLGVGVFYEPYSRVNYSVRRDSSIISDPGVGDTALYRMQYQGSGGLQQLTVGAGYRIGRYIRLGASANILFGIENDTRTTEFFSTNYSQTRLNSSTRLAGVSGTFGGLVLIPSLLGRRDILSLGASVTLPTTLDGRRVRTLGPEYQTDTLGTETLGSVRIPISIKGGVAYYADPRWQFIFDAVYEPWSDFTSDFVLAGYNSSSDNNFRDRYRVSGGLEFMPAGTDVNASFVKRTAYRLGAFYDQSYVNPVSNYNLNTVGLTAGFSLPSAFSGTRVDLNLEVGRQGTTDHGLVDNLVYRIYANVSIGERWFEKRRLR